MKQILYYMGPLTLVRWLFKELLMFERSRLKKFPQPNEHDTVTCGSVCTHHDLLITNLIN